MKNYSDCNINYQEIYYDFNINDAVYQASETEELIRVILIEDKKADKENKLKLGVITLDLEKANELYSNEYRLHLASLYVEYRKQLRQIFKKNLLNKNSKICKFQF